MCNGDTIKYVFVEIATSESVVYRGPDQDELQTRAHVQSWSY